MLKDKYYCLMPPYVTGVQCGALRIAAGHFYGLIQWSLGKENEYGNHILSFSSTALFCARKHSCFPIKQLLGAGHCIFFPPLCNLWEGKTQDLGASNAGRDALPSL